MGKVRKYKSIILRQERDRDLFEVYCKAIQNTDLKHAGDVYDYVRKQPAPKFYIEPDYLRGVIFRKNKNINNAEHSDLDTQRKFDELYERYIIVKHSNVADGKTLMDILEMIVNSPAPEFYISKRTARFIIARQRKLQWDSISKRYSRR